MLKPPKLHPGDKIATVSLSWGGPSVFPHRYQIGVQQLQDEFGLQVVEMPNTLKDADWLARNPKARADDWMQAFADPSIKGIVATIGGDDSICFVAHVTWRVVLDGDDTRVVPTYVLTDVEGERILDVADTDDLVSAR